jgi:hypothetical protein
VDISEHGLKFASEVELPVNTVLGLRLDLEEHLYRLEGEVRRSANEDTHYAGVMIDDDCADFNAWTDYFKFDF